MRTTEIFDNLIIEQVKNKKIYELLLKKWFGDNPSDADKHKCGQIMVKFLDVKNRIVPTAPEVITFLHNFRSFKTEQLSDITAYELQEIKFIIDEFYGPEEQIVADENPIFKGKNLPPTDDRINASKNLWYGDNKNLIVNEDGFRVYKITTRKDAINFGYYEAFVSNNPVFIESRHSHMPWCIARYMVDSNLWVSYRNRRSFYFVISEKYNPSQEKDFNYAQYYLTTLQFSTDTNNTSNFRLTTLLNDGTDPIHSPSELFRIYPQLENHIDKIQKQEFDLQAEVGEDTDIVNMINEVPNNRYEFKKMTSVLKKQYIDRGKILTKAESWESINNQLRTAYIDMTTKENLLERFSSIELFKAITGANKNSLNRRIKILGYETGVGYLTSIFMKDYYLTARIGKKNKNIRMLKNKQNNKYGLFDTIKDNWLEKDGVIYDDVFNKNGQRIDLYDEEMDDELSAQLYLGPDGKIFYTITYDNDIHLSLSYFLSKKAFDDVYDELTDDPSKINYPEIMDLGENNKGV